MTIFYPDISSFQAGISLKGALAACCKATEGTNYVNPDYLRAKQNAKANGTFFFAYHFLHHGSAVAQAEFCFRTVGKTPLMLDVEPEPGIGSAPTVADVLTFIAEYRKLGGVIHLIYLPRWYWTEQGSPLLETAFKELDLVLVSSQYQVYTNSSTQAGWLPYGGVGPTVWQYSDGITFNGFSVDFNAFKGHYAGKQDSESVMACLAEFKSIVTTGHYPASPNVDPKAYNPVKKLRVTPRYTQADVSWAAAPHATGYRVILRRGLKQIVKREGAHTFGTFNNLKPNTKYTVSVLALPAKLSDSLRGRARVNFTTEGPKTHPIIK